jgi:hypothetical protein
LNDGNGRQFRSPDRLDFRQTAGPGTRKQFRTLVTTDFIRKGWHGIEVAVQNYKKSYNDMFSSGHHIVRAKQKKRPGHSEAQIVSGRTRAYTERKLIGKGQVSPHTSLPSKQRNRLLFHN